LLPLLPLPLLLLLLLLFLLAAAAALAYWRVTLATGVLTNSISIAPQRLRNCICKFTDSRTNFVHPAVVHGTAANAQECTS
jgi:hypothetical protein